VLAARRIDGIEARVRGQRERGQERGSSDGAGQEANAHPLGPPLPHQNAASVLNRQLARERVL
jgi:hypothetical protein